MIRTNDVLHRLQVDTAMMECKHKPARMIMRQVALGQSAIGAEPAAIGLATCVCQSWRDLAMHSSVRVSLMPRNAREMGMLWHRRKQMDSLSFRMEMELVVDEAMDGDQV